MMLNQKEKYKRRQLRIIKNKKQIMLALYATIINRYKVK